MHGVTTALVAFLLVCVVFPHLVRHKAQYYAAFACVCLIVLLDALGWAVNGQTIQATRVFSYVLGGVLQVAAIILLFLACGGITWRQLAGDMKDAYEVLRRGGEEKEVIIPLSPEMQRMKEQRAAEREPPRQERINIDDLSAAPPPPSKPEEKGGIPLEP